MAKIERTGALRLLVWLLAGPQHIGQIAKKSADESGIATQQSIERSRRVLRGLGLIDEYEERTSPIGAARLYVRLTEKGKVVADHLKRVADVLAENDELLGKI